MTETPRKYGLLAPLIDAPAGITNPDDQLGARLFSTLMLVHIAIVVALVIAVSVFWTQATGDTIWDDLDTWVVVAAVLIIGVSYVLLRTGFYRTAIAIYIANAAVLPVTAPFVPDPHAEIAILTTAIVPVLLTAMAFSWRSVLGVLLAVVAVAIAQLAVTDLPIQRRMTGIGIVVSVAVAGVLLLVFQRHHAALERLRIARVLMGEENLRRSREQYHHLFETVMDEVFIANMDGVVVEANTAACRQLGYTREELIGMPLTKISARPPEEILGARQALMEQGHAAFETIHRRKDGSTLVVDLALSAVEFGGERACLGISRDLTARRRQEAENRRLAEQLQQAAKMESVGVLAGGVAHDFNNLLTAILGNAELASSEVNPGSPAAGYLDEIQKAAGSASALTRQLLAFSRKQILEPKVVDLNDLIGHMRNMLTRLIGEDVILRTAAVGEPARVLVDPGLVEQIIMNLAANARDAMPTGGTLTIETAVVSYRDDEAARPPVVEPGDYVRLSVTDTGVGIPAEIQERVFEPFFTTKPKGRGTGLGLATAYGAVKQSGGYIDLSSKEGVGTTFTIHLPRAASEPVVSDGSDAVERRGTETVLIVEDDEVVRNIGRRSLERLGYRVLVAGGGDEALRLSSGHAGPIHLLLTDVVMPSMHGRDLADRLKAIRPGVRVLYTSGYTDDAIVHRGVLKEGVSFIAKPYTPKALGVKVRQVLDQP